MYYFIAMTDTARLHPNNPLHGITLETILNALVARYGWLQLSKIIEIRCFFHEPSIKSSLKFLRHTPWARAKVEKLYLDMQEQENCTTETQRHRDKNIDRKCN